MVNLLLETFPNGVFFEKQAGVVNFHLPLNSVYLKKGEQPYNAGYHIECDLNNFVFKLFRKTKLVDSLESSDIDSITGWLAWVFTEAHIDYQLNWRGEFYVSTGSLYCRDMAIRENTEIQNLCWNKGTYDGNVKDMKNYSCSWFRLADENYEAFLPRPNRNLVIFRKYSQKQEPISPKQTVTSFIRLASQMTKVVLDKNVLNLIDEESETHYPINVKYILANPATLEALVKIDPKGHKINRGRGQLNTPYPITIRPDKTMAFNELLLVFHGKDITHQVAIPLSQLQIGP